MKVFSAFLPDEAATTQVASDLVPTDLSRLSGLTLALRGELGVGKTSFCRGLLRALGHEGAVKSPTFTLVEPYFLAGLDVFHFDLYRLTSAEELEYIGVDDYFSSAALCLIEWPDRGAGRLPAADLCVYLSIQDSGRRLRLAANSARGADLLGELRWQ